MQGKVKDLTEKAEAGDLDAQYTLGRMYYDGQDVPKDCKKAAKWIAKAAGQQLTEAKEFFDHIYGNDQEKDDGHDCNNLDSPDDYWWDPDEFEHTHPDATREEYEKWYADEYELRHPEEDEEEPYSCDYNPPGDAEMQFNIGLVYFNGKDVVQDTSKALKWWFRAAEQEQLNRNPSVFDYCLPKEDSEAVSYLENLGFRSSDFMTGTYYYLGKGVKRDYEKALRHFKMCAEIITNDESFYNGLAQAQIMIGSIYNDGKAPIDLNFEACEYYFLAKMNGASFEISKALSDIFTTDDINVAHSMLRPTAEQEKIVMLEKTKLVVKLAKNGCPDAQYELGRIKQNQTEALKWYKKAAEQGNGKALHECAKIYKSATLVPKDYKKEFKWLVEQITKLSLADKTDLYEFDNGSACDPADDIPV
jgi:TPR repeat protein